jgi:hypothetical protein
MKTQLSLLLACLLLLAAPASAAPADNALPAASAAAPGPVNRAGEQRMLVQRIAKSFMQIGLNVLPLPAKNELDAAVQRFEANLRALEQHATSEDARSALRTLDAAWQPLKQTTRGTPRRATAILVSHLADEALLAAERLTRVLQNSAGPATGSRLVALAGRQRMLSQRMAKAYLLISWDDHSEATREELDAAINEFSGGLTVLKGRSENSPTIGRELEDMSLQWEWLQNAMASEGAANYRLIVAEASESILQAADHLTSLYEQLPP